MSKDEQGVFTQSAASEDNAYHLEPFDAGTGPGIARVLRIDLFARTDVVLSAIDTDRASIGLVVQNAEGFESL